MRAEAKNRFEGWYFKHQKGDQMTAFIPGRAAGGPFIQMIDNGTSRQFSVPSLRVKRGVLYAGDCRFSRRGAVVKLPGVEGTMHYGPLTPLQSDIMGPFRHLPMQCRHGVISMGHAVSGTLWVEGKSRCFDGAHGYIEMDTGCSFPSSYLWLQCNDFDQPCAMMLSIAHIPFVAFSFTGCICAIVFQNREYRLATYCGVRIRRAEKNRICLSQGKLLLWIDLKSPPAGHPLRSPIRGEMSGVIRECTDVPIRARLWENGKKVFDLRSAHATFEAVGEHVRDKLCEENKTCSYSDNFKDMLQE